MTYIAPVAQWPEPPSSSAAIALTLLTPYLLTDGSVEFLARGDAVPGGAVVATLRDSGDGTEEVVSGASAGRRVVQTGAGQLFFT